MTILRGKTEDEILDTLRKEPNPHRYWQKFIKEEYLTGLKFILKNIAPESLIQPDINFQEESFSNRRAAIDQIVFRNMLGIGCLVWFSIKHNDNELYEIVHNVYPDDASRIKEFLEAAWRRNITVFVEPVTNFMDDDSNNVSVSSFPMYDVNQNQNFVL